MSKMPVETIINCVTKICKECNVKHLSLFGSVATGDDNPSIDIDFVVYGCPDYERLEKELETINTLRKIDIFEYENIHNEYLLEDIRLYGRKIY